MNENVPLSCSLKLKSGDLWSMEGQTPALAEDKQFKQFMVLREGVSANCGGGDAGSSGKGGGASMANAR